MARTIDIHDLPEEEARLVQEFAEFLKERAKIRKEKTRETEGKDETVFATWPLGVKGKLTRRDIYDHL